ncbi:MAG: preprotein translocase subunit SecE [Gammaproteobacteria bacterium]|jgi:preprotein translocase subunit SecE|nr:preprotein translocase subunit SecE [Gammaproteobacteria bacterium]NDC10750.1 preprotein translocase subunit SecE [Oxalobacteraceae bacterium]
MNEAVKNDGVTGADKAKLWAAILIAAAGIASFYVLKGEQADWVRWLVFAGGLIVAGAVFFLSQYGRDFWKFALDARIELYKVFWPTRQETGTMTAVVFVFVIIMALFFWGVDSILGWLTKLILGGPDAGV